MRVLVLATDPQWTPGTQLMGSLAAGLAARGDVVAVACASRSHSEQALEQTWPRLSVRAVTGGGWFRQAMSVRGIVTALRPDAILVGSRSDAVLAAYATGKRGAIVQRYAVDEREGFPSADDDDALPWRARFALSRATITPWGARSIALGWPHAAVASDQSSDHAIHRLPVVSPHVVLVPAAEHDDSTAAALRALAHVRSRHAELRISLVGASSALQATRLHAAALDLTSAVQLVPMEALLHHTLNSATEQAAFAWVAAAGDTGALATLAAMQQGLPVVVSSTAAFAELVAPGITGFHVSPDSSANIVADVARVLSDAEVQQAMGQAAVARAAREYSWDAFVDHAADLLARASGIAAARVTRRPSFTPAAG